MDFQEYLINKPFPKTLLKLKYTLKLNIKRFRELNIKDNLRKIKRALNDILKILFKLYKRKI